MLTLMLTLMLALMLTLMLALMLTLMLTLSDVNSDVNSDVSSDASVPTQGNQGQGDVMHGYGWDGANKADRIDPTDSNNERHACMNNEQHAAPPRPTDRPQINTVDVDA